MATILVDYENVHANNGLKGTEYLNEKDTLVIFYSQSCGKIRCDFMEEIEASGCEFRICKLLKAGKNALDFYIAAECGSISEQGENQIAIVSNDKGFSAIVDFFKIKSDGKTTVVTAANIEGALMSLNDSEDTDRRRLIHDKTKMLDLAAAQARNEEKQSFREKLKEALENTGYSDMYKEILSYIEGNRDSTPKVLYTGSLHKFGRENGVRIYQILKKVV